MGYRKKLFDSADPYDIRGTEKIFLAAMRECCAFHYRNCADYKKILDGFSFSPSDIKNSGDLADIPFIPTLYLKTHKMFSMPEYFMPIKATSSGTGGKFSVIGMDAGSLYCGFKMVMRIAGERGILSAKPCHYIVLGYKPHISNKTAIAKTAFGYTLLAPAVSRTYALKYKNGGYYPDLDGVANAVRQYARSPFPTRFIGFPAYTWFMLKLMDEKKMYVRLPKGSMIMLGGGWKQFYKEKVDKSEMYALAKKVLDIDEEYILESYGAAEHPILYCDCKNHHFHIPIYSRVVIRDTNTLKPVKNGTMGLVDLITPLIYATPVASILTDDLGILHDAEECGCGINSPYLEIIGRAGINDIKTCAAGAEEILKNRGGTELDTF